MAQSCAETLPKRLALSAGMERHCTNATTYEGRYILLVLLASCQLQNNLPWSVVFRKLVFAMCTHVRRSVRCESKFRLQVVIINYSLTQVQWVGLAQSEAVLLEDTSTSDKTHSLKDETEKDGEDTLPMMTDEKKAFARIAILQAVDNVLLKLCMGLCVCSYVCVFKYVCMFLCYV